MHPKNSTLNKYNWCKPGLLVLISQASDLDIIYQIPNDYFT